MELYAAILNAGNALSWSEERVLGIYDSREKADVRCLEHQEADKEYGLDRYESKPIVLNEAWE